MHLDPRRVGRRDPAAAPLIAALLERHPESPILVTHMTPTGREAAESLFGDRVLHAYLAYDYPFAVAAFFRHWRPRIGIVMETEIWPALMAAAVGAGTPMVLANARLSPKSLVATRRWTTLMRPAASRFDRILAQSDADAARFAILLDVEFRPAAQTPIRTLGNVKFDVQPPPAQRELGDRFRRGFGDGVQVFLCASTRDGEEAAILDAWLRHAVSGDPGRLLLAIVPRHPQRFDDVVALARARV